MAAEGWYTDPFRLHEHRWFSDGTPTYLVRDGGRTSKERTAGHALRGGAPVGRATAVPDDLRRSGGTRDDGVDPVEAAWTYFTRSGPGL